MIHVPQTALAAAVISCGLGCTQIRSVHPLVVARAAESDPIAAAHVWRVRQNAVVERSWGVEVIGVRLTASEWMLEFKYRVTDPEKARELLAHDAKPCLTDRQSGAKLAVPAMENVGELRQTAAPAIGRDYFILFGNANKIVRRGNLVDIEISGFHADGVTVE